MIAQAAGRSPSAETVPGEIAGPAEVAVEIRIGSIEVATSTDQPAAQEPSPVTGPRLTGFADQLARRSYVSTDRGRY
jgi:hypothetical protein